MTAYNDMRINRHYCRRAGACSRRTFKASHAGRGGTTCRAGEGLTVGTGVSDCQIVVLCQFNRHIVNRIIEF